MVTTNGARAKRGRSLLGELAALAQGPAELAHAAAVEPGGLERQHTGRLGGGGNLRRLGRESVIPIVADAFRGQARLDDQYREVLAVDEDVAEGAPEGIESR